MGSLGHLTKRFFGSLLPIGPTRRDDEWAREHLLVGEQQLWNRMSAQDRRHAAGVARLAHEYLGEPEREVTAAALLHDVGKIDANLGTIRRALATIAVVLAGRDTAELWVKSSGMTRRFGLYVKHPEIGADLLELADSHPLTVAWAREHHVPPAQTSLPLEIAEALALADND